MSFQLDGFEIGESIGSGGFGEVWAARQIGVDRPVAIKVGHLPLVETKDRLRFERECKALGRLSTHPNIATVHTSGTLVDGRPYLVLEYADGGDLLAWASSHRATEAQLLSIGIDLAGAVAEAHRNEIVHRDLKPENVLLRTNGDVVLGDFGIAQMQDGLRTATGNVTASVAYAPPEVLSGQRANDLVDVYGIGICLLVAGTGTVPFTEPTDESLHPVLTRVLTQPPPQLDPSRFRPEVNDLVQRLLAKDSADRPPTAEAVVSELRALSGGIPLNERPSPQSTMARIPIADRATEAVAPAPPPVPAPPSPSMPVSEPLAQQTAAAPPIQGDLSASGSNISDPAKLALIGGGVAAVMAVLLIGFFLIRSGGDGENEVATGNTEQETSGSTEEDDKSDNESGSSASESDGSESDSGSSSSSENSSTETTVPPPVFDPTEPLLIDEELKIALDFRDHDLTLQAEQMISVEVTGLNGSCERDDRWNLAIHFLDPNGEPVVDAVQPAFQGCSAWGGPDWMALEDGDYTIRFSSFSSGSSSPTGSYQVAVNVLDNARIPIDISGAPVEVSGEIVKARDRIGYTFEGQAGDIVTAYVNDTNGSCDRDDRWNFLILLSDPAGESMVRSDETGVRSDGELYGNPGNFGCGNFGFWVLESAGTYTMKFVGQGTSYSDSGIRGTYKAQIGKAVVTETEISLDAGTVTLSGDLDQPSNQDRYKVELAEGDLFSIQITAMNGACERENRWDMRMIVFDPSGVPMADRTETVYSDCPAVGPFTVTESGTHTIMFWSGFGDLDASDVRLPTGTYEAVIGRLGG